MKKPLLETIGDTEQTNFGYELTIRQTKWVLLPRTVVSLAILGLLYIILWSLNIVSPWMIVLLITIVLIYIGVGIVDWMLEYYKLKPQEIEHREGVFFIRKEIILLKNVEKIYLVQGLLGRLLNYGTVRLYAPTISQDFRLQFVSQPELFIKALEKIVHQQKSDLKIIKK